MKTNKLKFIAATLFALAMVAEFVFGHGSGVMVASMLAVLPTDDEETKKAKNALIEAKNAAVEEAKELLAKAIKPDSAEFKSAIEAILKSAIAEIKVKQGNEDVLIADAFKGMQTQFDLLATMVNEGEFKEKKKVTFKGSLSKALESIKSELSNAKNKKGLNKTVELKDMDFDNFSTEALDILTSQTLPGIYANPWSQLWLRNIFPSASTTSDTIKYIQEDNEANEDNGAADIWNGKLPIADLLAKPDVDFSFKDATADVYWLAGITRIKREMLDDIAFLRSYIPQQLVYGKRGIFIRENALILSTMNTNSVLYDGVKTLIWEQIYDAAVGQLLDNYHAGTHILMNHREAADIANNKASGSGEYDLPKYVNITPTGQLTIAGLPVIGLPQFAAGTAFVLDARQSLFVSRMSPEVQFFEQDRDNVVKNLITIRAEERATQLVFDPTSIIRVVSGS